MKTFFPDGPSDAAIDVVAATEMHGAGMNHQLEADMQRLWLKSEPSALADGSPSHRSKPTKSVHLP